MESQRSSISFTWAATFRCDQTSRECRTKIWNHFYNVFDFVRSSLIVVVDQFAASATRIVSSQILKFLHFTSLSCMEKGNNCVEVRKLRQPPCLARIILPLIAPSWLMVSTLTNITAGGWKMCFSCSFYWYADFPKSGYLSSSNNDGHLSLSFLNFRKYWHCAGGKGQHITCPEDQWNGNKREDQQYNAEGVMCDWDKRVDCGDR